MCDPTAGVREFPTRIRWRLKWWCPGSNTDGETNEGRKGLGQGDVPLRSKGRRDHRNGFIRGTEKSDVFMGDVRTQEVTNSSTDEEADWKFIQNRRDGGKRPEQLAESKMAPVTLPN